MKNAPNEWTCEKCGEVISDTYAVCWNCSAARPGYQSQADAAKEDEQLLTDARRQTDYADEILELQMNNEKRYSTLLRRWENLTDHIERIVKKSNKSE